jgi:uncharacterized RDD family membrane protein YckC
VSTSPSAYGPPVVIGEGVALDLRTAGIGSRAVALLVDLVIQIGVLVGLLFIAAAAALHMNGAAATAIVLVLYIVLFVGYPVGFETLARGRTPGKMVLGLRVVREDGGPITFRHAFTRGIVGVVLDRPGLSIAVLSLVPMLISRRSKRLGDFAAGTIVLQERVPARVGVPPPMPLHLVAWAAGLDLSGVDDALAMAVRQFLTRAPQLSPWAREDLANRLVAAVAERVGTQPPAGTPGWAYLSAVTAERRRRELERHVSQPAAPSVIPPTPSVMPPAVPPSPAPAAEGPFAPPG